MARSLVFYLFLCWLSALSFVVAQPVALYRINTNGPAFTDSSGRAWSADNYFVTPGLTFSVTNMNIDTTGPGVSDPLLYRTERYRADVKYSFPGKSQWCSQSSSSSSVLTFSCSSVLIAVASGFYTVILHFAGKSWTAKRCVVSEQFCILTLPFPIYAEIYDGTDEPGLRVFDIKLQGVKVKSNFDITAAAGAPYKAIVLEFPVEITGNSLDITFGKITEKPKVSWFSVIAVLYFVDSTC